MNDSMIMYQTPHIDRPIPMYYFAWSKLTSHTKASIYQSLLYCVALTFQLTMFFDILGPVLFVCLILLLGSPGVPLGDKRSSIPKLCPVCKICVSSEPLREQVLISCHDALTSQLSNFHSFSLISTAKHFSQLTFPKKLDSEVFPPENLNEAKRQKKWISGAKTIIRFKVFW